MATRNGKATEIPLSRLTRHEIAASRAGGFLDDRVPTEAIRARLKNEGAHEFNGDAIIGTLGNACGWYRLTNVPRLTDAELAKQARVTAAMAEELSNRIRNMHPTLKGCASLYWYRARQVNGPEQSFMNGLIQLEMIMKATAKDIDKSKKRTGPKADGERNHALRRAYEAVRENSTPKLTAGNARALARDLLALCMPEISLPTDKDELRRITG